MDIKKPLTFEDQVKRLVTHKMDVSNVDFAKRILAEVNYYRFSGYALQYRDKNNPDDYVIGTRFEDVWRLYQFDNELRCILKVHLDSVEIYMRSQIAYEFSMTKCSGPPYNQHYDNTHFYNKASHSEIITSSLDREKENNKDALFVIHHSDKYEGKMPLWVIVELLSFTNLLKLYSAMYHSGQDAIAQNVGVTGQVLKNHLHCMANLRNKVAHAGRLYNALYNPPVKLGSSYLQRNPKIKSNTFFAYIIVLMRKLPNKTAKALLATTIIDTMVQYEDCIHLSLLGFPVEYVRLLCDEIR